MAKTSAMAKDLHGAKLYQERARKILPILVRQAASKQPLSYEALADELDMSNPRVLNYPLGCVGRAIVELSEYWGEKIPHIQSLVVNKQSRLPGPGFDDFLTDEGYEWDGPIERRSVIEQYRTKIFGYSYWNDVLSSLRLSPAMNEIADLIEVASTSHGHGEGAEHKALKEFVRSNPAVIGLSADHPDGSTERGIPSGDRLDVLFAHKGKVCVAEVKPRNAPLPDITRGLFQCVKYRAVLEAHAAFANEKSDVTVCLALGGALPEKLIPLRNSLRVSVFENLANLMPSEVLACLVN